MSGADDTAGQQQKRVVGVPFQPGQSGNPAGRPKGSRNKLGEAFLDNLYADWQEHGVTALQECRQQNPAAYVKTVASLLPKQVEVSTNGIASMSDDELSDLINAIREADGAVIQARSREDQEAIQTVAH